MTTPDLFSVPVGGGDLTVAQWGDGPAVLAIHGITSTSRTWLAVGRALGGRATLIAPDLRGRGRSNTLPPPKYGSQ